MRSAATIQLTIVTVLTIGTGSIVGVTKLLQILATTTGGRFETTSESIAEEFLVSFGLAKAISNVIAGAISDTRGRRICMLLGWLFGALFSFSILFCGSWSAVVACDLLLGINQALCWSAALFVAHDLLGPTRRGVASGLVETSGYAAIALSSPIVDAIGLRGFVGMHVVLLCVCVGCALLTIALRETKAAASSSNAIGPRASDNGASAAADARTAVLEWPSGRREGVSSVRMAYAHASCLDGGLMACCLIGLCLNLATAYAWGAMSRWLAQYRIDSGDAAGGLSVGSVLLLYSIPKGVLQLPAGRLADTRACCGIGAAGLVILGVLINACVLLIFAGLTTLADHDALPLGSAVYFAAPLAFLLGAGTALAYSPVMACVAYRADPSWRASALGAYRFWRDAGYAIGAIILGGSADSVGGSLWLAPLLAAAALLIAAGIFAKVYTYGGPVHVWSQHALAALDSATTTAAAVEVEMAVDDGARDP